MIKSQAYRSAPAFFTRSRDVTRDMTQICYIYGQFTELFIDVPAEL